ncbi:MAG: hypothetical protein PW788_12345 [Micavibrio sp.]|nr:hypothetical protein [Micavibrio sp.]
MNNLEAGHTIPASNAGPAMAVNERGSLGVNTDYIASLDQQIDSLENNTDRLHALLQRHAGTLEHEGLRRDTDLLLNWMTQSADGLRTVRKLFESGPGWLNDLKERMRLGREELERLESEGGNLAPRAATDQSRELAEVWRGVDTVIVGLEPLFANAPAEQPVEGDVQETVAGDEPVALLC